MTRGGVAFAISRESSDNVCAAPLFVVPSVGPRRSFEAHREAWILRELFVEPKLPFVLVDLSPDEMVPGDGHPGPAAHRRLADAIEAALPRAVERVSKQ